MDAGAEESLFLVLLEVKIPKLDGPVVIRDVHDERELQP
jgi:hypothetical protein